MLRTSFCAEFNVALEDFKMAAPTASEKIKNEIGRFLSKKNIKRLQRVEQIRKVRVKIKNRKRKQNKTGTGRMIVELGYLAEELRVCKRLCIS